MSFENIIDDPRTLLSDHPHFLCKPKGKSRKSAFMVFSEPTYFNLPRQIQSQFKLKESRVNIIKIEKTPDGKVYQLEHGLAVVLKHGDNRFGWGVVEK